MYIYWITFSNRFVSVQFASGKSDTWSGASELEQKEEVHQLKAVFVIQTYSLTNNESLGLFVRFVELGKQEVQYQANQIMMCNALITMRNNCCRTIDYKTMNKIALLDITMGGYFWKLCSP